MKLKIKIVLLGYLPKSLDFKTIENWKSDIFSIISVERIPIDFEADLPGWAFSDEVLSQKIPASPYSDIVFIIANIPLKHGWYSRKLSNNRVIYSLQPITNLLSDRHIPLKNAILRALYANSLIYLKIRHIPISDSSTRYTHDEVRGCIFDMNGASIFDLAESCDRPTLCDQCCSTFFGGETGESKERMTRIKNELSGITIGLFEKIFRFIQKYPVRAFVLSSLYAIALGVLTSFIYDLTKQN